MSELDKILFSKGIKSVEIIQERKHEPVLYLTMLDGTCKSADCLPGIENIKKYFYRRRIKY